MDVPESCVSAGSELSVVFSRRHICVPGAAMQSHMLQGANRAPLCPASSAAFFPDKCS